MKFNSLNTATILLFAALLGCQSSPKKENISNAPSEIKIELVKIKSEDSTLLNAYLFRPQGKGPFPAIIALHGCAGLFKNDGQFNPRDEDWGKRLANNGYVVIYPDSFTTRGLKSICRAKTAKRLSYETRPQDALGALSWLQQLDYVKKDNIGLMGWSNGGSALLETINSKQKLVYGFKIAIAFYPGCVKAEQNSEWKNQVPLEVLIGELDNWTLPKSCINLVKRLKTKTDINITLYPDSYHDFDSPDLPLKVLKNLTYAPPPNHTATIGTNENSRKLAITKVLEVLKANL